MTAKGKELRAANNTKAFGNHRGIILYPLPFIKS